MRTRALLFVFPLASLTLVACAAAPDSSADPARDEGATGEAASALPAGAVLPSGFTCGLSYTDNRLQSYHGGPVASCDGQPLWQAWGNFSPVADGDFGAPAGYGYRHLSPNANIGNVVGPGSWFDTTSLRLPKGTTCGFHHTKNSPYESCMGHHPENGDCPAGFRAYKQYDDESDGGWFAWCAYDDPRGYCADRGTCLDGVPQGTTCGLHYANSGWQEWLPDSKALGCEGTVVTNQCPTGYALRHGGNMGASSGWGLSWCEKQ